MKATMDGQSYTFKPDGKEYPTPWGSVASWKSIDANTWEVTNKANGKVVSVDTFKVSPDGKSLTLDSKVMKATGETSSNAMTFQRLSGHAGTGRQVASKKLQEQLSRLDRCRRQRRGWPGPDFRR
jgi:hypothetical protein